MKGLKSVASGQAHLGQVTQALQASVLPSVKWVCYNHSLCVTRTFVSSPEHRAWRAVNDP